MIFADLAAGDSVFLDANTFIYHFGPDPALGPPCSQLPPRRVMPRAGRTVRPTLPLNSPKAK
jgi:hypothetical protein